MLLCNADNIFYMANFTRNLAIGNYFFVLFNLKNSEIQVKVILATV